MPRQDLGERKQEPAANCPDGLVQCDLAVGVGSALRKQEPGRRASAVHAEHQQLDDVLAGQVRALDQLDRGRILLVGARCYQQRYAAIRGGEQVGEWWAAGSDPGDLCDTWPLEKPLQAREPADRLNDLPKVPSGAFELNGIDGRLGRVSWRQFRLLQLCPCVAELLEGALIQFA